LLALILGYEDEAFALARVHSLAIVVEALASALTLAAMIKATATAVANIAPLVVAFNFVTLCSVTRLKVRNNRGGTVSGETCSHVRHANIEDIVRKT
jgi:hypothetical protein